MNNLTFKVCSADGTIKAQRTDADRVMLVFNDEYAEGDYITFEVEKPGVFVVLMFDDAIGESFVYMKAGSTDFEVPFGEKKVCYQPKCFMGNMHLMSARIAEKYEIDVYKNLACNKYDLHGDRGIFPHASANVETRGESVFAAKNAINGNCENHSHGFWPYESWGINQDPNAEMTLDFGRKIKTDKIVLYTRADFPHDAWWESVTFNFSDGSVLTCSLEKSDKPHVITFDEKEIEWLKFGKLIKADDPSPFPALSQIEVYGTEA